jgi:hypothetical protein
MRFPLRLTADLALGLATKTLRGASSNGLILHLSPVAGSSSPFGTPEDYSSTSVSHLHLSSLDVCLDAVQRSSAPIVWIGGAEPLLHPEIGRLARRIVDTGRHVFVQTNGAYLQRRIHEFRPVSRLFLALQFHGFEQLHDVRARREGAFRAALEGIRTAKLSGFLVCAQMAVHADTGAAEFEQLQGVLEARDVDGFVVAPASGYLPGGFGQSESQTVRHKLRAAGHQIRSRRWRLFSGLLNSSLPEANSIAQSRNESGHAAPFAANAGAENVEVS